MLLPGLLETARRNVATREERVHVFEIGRTFHLSDGELPVETKRAAFLIAGAWTAPAWIGTGAPTDFFLAKGLVERLAAALGLELRFGEATEDFLHPGKSAVVEDPDGRTIGWLGEVHPLVLQEYDLRGFSAVAAELDLQSLIALRRETRMFRELSSYPPVEQDLALVVDRDLPAADVVAAVRAAAGELLRDVSIFDLYEGDQIARGKKSLALRLSFRSEERTLSEAEINDVRGKVLDSLAGSIGAALRV